MKATKILFMLLALISFGAMISCSDDDDDDYIISYPDGSELGMIVINSNTEMVGFYNDDDDYYAFTSAVPVTNASLNIKPDTTYRALIMYTNAGIPGYVNYYEVDLLNVARPITPDDVEEMKTDPIQAVTEIWVSNNASFINMALDIFATQGTTEQRIDFVNMGKNEQGHTVLEMYHDQVNVFDYQMHDVVYLGIPIKGYFESGEVVDIIIKIYDKDSGVGDSEGNVTTTITIPELRTDVDNL